MPNFKFDSQLVFLTYPRCGLEHVAIADHLRTLRDIAWARVCSELHEDGQPHRHVVAKFVTRYQTRNQRAFDVSGFHPNIQSVRSVARALKYVTKDGEFTDYGTVPDPKARAYDGPDWRELAKTCNYGEFLMEAVKWKLPHAFAKDFWLMGAKQTCEVKTDYVANLEWEHESLHTLPAAGGTNVIIGPSGMGKTSWTKRVCQKPALWVRHLDVLRSFRAEYHKSIIFDDMSFTHIPIKSQIHLVDQQDEAQIHCRYSHAVIPPGTQRFFTSNDWPFTRDGSENAVALERRITASYNLF